MAAGWVSALRWTLLFWLLLFWSCCGPVVLSALGSGEVVGVSAAVSDGVGVLVGWLVGVLVELAVAEAVVGGSVAAPRAVVVLMVDRASVAATTRVRRRQRGCLKVHSHLRQSVEPRDVLQCCVHVRDRRHRRSSRMGRRDVSAVTRMGAVV
jgi:hypothetical protein